MRLGDLLIRSKQVTPEQLEEALELQTMRGGRLGDHLIALGAITRVQLDAFSAPDADGARPILRRRGSMSMS